MRGTSLNVATTTIVVAAGKVGPNVITPLQVGLGAVLVLVNACISVYLDLGLEVALAIAIVRCVALAETLMVSSATYERQHEESSGSDGEAHATWVLPVPRCCGCASASRWLLPSRSHYLLRRRAISRCHPGTDY